MGAHWLDPDPGMGRITRAYQVALSTQPDEIRAAADVNASQLRAWLGIDVEEAEQGRSRTDTRREIARRMGRAMVARVALRLCEMMAMAERSTFDN